MSRNAYWLWVAMDFAVDVLQSWLVLTAAMLLGAFV
jgi:hypothetical protein